MVYVSPVFILVIAAFFASVAAAPAGFSRSAGDVETHRSLMSPRSPVIGVKVWIYQGEIMKPKPKPK